MILIQRKQTSINVTTNIDDYIIVDTELGNDDTAQINSSNSCKTLKKAIELADIYNKNIKIRIIKDYNLDNDIAIARINTNKIVITCENDSIISNLTSAINNQGDTSYVPYFIYNDGLFIENAAACDEYDAINYIEGNIISIVTPPIQNGGNYINTIELPKPDLSFTLDSKIHLYSMWHNIICNIIEIRENSIIVETPSVNYNYQVNQECKYRIINCQGLKEGFLYTKSDNTYTIKYNSTFKYIPKITSLKVLNSVNIEFDNCIIIGLNIFINNSYAITFNSCKFQYCNSIQTHKSIVNFKNNYFFKTQLPLITNESSAVIISNNIFKGCKYIQIKGAGLIQYNEFCYGINAAIYYNNINRKHTLSDRKKCVICNNYIHHMGQLLHGDYAAIYGIGNSNCDIYYNVIKDCVGRPSQYYHGIYMDEGANNVSIKYNIVINCNRNFKTHFGYGNIVYNNLSAYPVKDHIAYDLNGTLQSATSFIANIFYEGTVNYLNVLSDNALFQYNLFDSSVNTSPPFLNYKTTIPFTDPKNCDFSLSVNPFKYSIISIGSTDVRNKNQSFIDTSFFDKKIKYGITETHPYKDLAKFDLQLQYQGVLYDYDKWFKLTEKYFYNIENEYLNNI